MMQCLPCTGHNLIPIQVIENPYEIIDVCCDYFKVSQKDMFSKKRERNIVFARHTAMFILHSDRKMMLTLIQIGGIFNGRDHTTIIHAIRTISGLMDVYKEKREIISSLYKKIYGSTDYLKYIRYKHK